MVKILCIGNSFSEDAVHYLSELATAYGEKLYVANLFIGGCSLSQHADNLESDQAVYDYQLNGQATQEKIALKKAIMAHEWNYVTLQQASYDSGKLETYHPALEKLVSFLQLHAPNAQIVLHQTWAYELDSDHPGFQAYHCDQIEMFDKICACYTYYANELQLPVIPSGSFIQSLRCEQLFDYAHGGRSLCRDGFHMDFGIGRYALSALWLHYFFNTTLSSTSYIPKSISETDWQYIDLIHQKVNTFTKTVTS